MAASRIFYPTERGGDEYIVAHDAAAIQGDFWEAIKAGADIVDVQWKPLDQILDGFRFGAQARYARHEAKELEAFAGPGIPSRGRRTED